MRRPEIRFLLQNGFEKVGLWCPVIDILLQMDYASWGIWFRILNDCAGLEIFILSFNAQAMNSLADCLRFRGQTLYFFGPGICSEVLKFHKRHANVFGEVCGFFAVVCVGVKWL